MRLERLPELEGAYTRDELILICAWKTERSKSRVATNTETEAEFANRPSFSLGR